MKRFGSHSLVHLRHTGLLGKAGPASLRMHDIKGALVRVLVEGWTPEGKHEITWDGTDERGNPVASGVYLVKLEAGGYREARKTVLAK